MTELGLSPTPFIMKRWIVKNPKEGPEIDRIPGPIVQILSNRGYQTEAEITRFLYPSLTQLNDPFLFQDMEKAIDRIQMAIRNREPILIFGDYDVDGVTGTALLTKILSQLGGKPVYYLPHRIREGYGFSRLGVDYALSCGARLIVTVDCGITGHDALRYAQHQKIDVIVCDHHTATVSPTAFAVLDPKVDPGYPYPELSGCGVAFKLAQGLYIKEKRPIEELYQYLDLVAIATIADVCPLNGENRVITHFGLELLNRTRNLGLKKLIEVANLQKEITSYHVGFIIGPRINAAGRIAEAKKGIKLLLTDDEKEAELLASELNRINQDRKDIEDQILNEAKMVIEAEGIPDRVIVLARDGWHEGVIGIVASRLTDEYYRPAFLISLTEERGKGSARGIAGFDVFGALTAAAPVLDEFGGHREAGGFSLKREKICRLKELLEDYARSFPAEIFQPRLFIDTEIELGEINSSLLDYLERFEPTGTGNPSPTFLTRAVTLVGYPRVVGSDHLRFAVIKNNHHQQAIYFGHGALIERLEVGRSQLDIVYTVVADPVAARKRPILKIKDLRIRDVGE